MFGTALLQHTIVDIRITLEYHDLAKDFYQRGQISLISIASTEMLDSESNIKYTVAVLTDIRPHNTKGGQSMSELGTIKVNDLGRRIASLRNEKGWKQSDLADAIGVSQGAISYAERTPESLTVERLNQIAEAFDITVAELAFGKSQALSMAFGFASGRLGGVVFAPTADA